MYDDDILTGGPGLTTALLMQIQLQQILKAGGFKLHKWASNMTELLSAARDIHEETPSSRRIGDDEYVHTLGLIWEPANDTFGYQVKLRPVSQAASKRSILSDISRLFDPIG